MANVSGAWIYRKTGSMIYTADGVDGTVSVVDTAKQERIKTIEVGSFPWGVALDD